MPRVTIDGKTVEVREGAYILEAARLAKVHIPTLCHHEAVEPYGGCRLCMVDIWKPGWDPDWFRLVIACLYPVEEGLVVYTKTERVMEARRVVLDLLLARCPNTPLIQQLAREYGIEKTTYRERENPDDCILCGLCFRVCEKIGPAAIGAANRGSLREIATPFYREPQDCIGCLACAEVCPTSHIKYEDDGFTRTIWGKRFTLLRCRDCGRAIITQEQARWLEARGIEVEDLCDNCKQKRTSALSLRLRKGAL